MIYKCLNTLFLTDQKLIWDSRTFALLICRKNGQINILCFFTFVLPGQIGILRQKSVTVAVLVPVKICTGGDL